MTTLRYDAGAAAYDRLTGRWSVMFAAAALDAVVVSPTDAILDLAAGTGDGALLAIQRLDPLGTVIGVDLSVPMLAVAQSKPSSRPLTSSRQTPSDCHFSIACSIRLSAYSG